MVTRHYPLNGHESEQTPEDSGGERSLVCCSSQRIEHDLATEQHHHKDNRLAFVWLANVWLAFGYTDGGAGAWIFLFKPGWYSEESLQRKLFAVLKLNNRKTCCSSNLELQYHLYLLHFNILVICDFFFKLDISKNDALFFHSEVTSLTMWSFEKLVFLELAYKWILLSCTVLMVWNTTNSSKNDVLKTIEIYKKIFILPIISTELQLIKTS